MENNVPINQQTRRRIGGTPWHPIAPPTFTEGDSATLNGAMPGSGLSAPEAFGSGPASKSSARSRRRRRRRPWFRRKLVIIPLFLSLLVLSTAGIIGYRAESTIATLHEQSTPPKTAVDNTLNDDPIPTSIAIDTAPAIAAVRAANAAKHGDAPVQGGAAASPVAPASDEESGGGSGILNRVKEAANNASDIGAGAAVAAGVKDPETTAVTLLIMGVDARPGAPIDVGVRPDALAVVRLDPTTGTCRLLAIPRDTRVDLPGYGPGKINYALMVGGVPYQQLVVENLLGIPLDGYTLIDFVAFQEVVDAVGGVDVDVPATITLGDGTEVKEGKQSMNGEQALAFARYRGTDGDVGRIKRQWAVLRALSEVEGRRDLVRDVNTLLPVVSDHLRSDLEVADMAAIARAFGSRCTADSIQTEVLAGTTVRMDDAMLGQTATYNVVDDAQIRTRVNALLGALPF